jgi:hypothetical protein
VFEQAGRLEVSTTYRSLFCHLLLSSSLPRPPPSNIHRTPSNIPPFVITPPSLFTTSSLDLEEWLARRRSLVRRDARRRHRRLETLPRPRNPRSLPVMLPQTLRWALLSLLPRAFHLLVLRQAVHLHKPSRPLRIMLLRTTQVRLHSRPCFLHIHPFEIS